MSDSDALLDIMKWFHADSKEVASRRCRRKEMIPEECRPSALEQLRTFKAGTISLILPDRMKASILYRLASPTYDVHVPRRSDLGAVFPKSTQVRRLAPQMLYDRVANDPRQVNFG
jgi:hypothetical protein